MSVTAYNIDSFQGKVDFYTTANFSQEEPLKKAASVNFSLSSFLSSIFSIFAQSSNNKSINAKPLSASDTAIMFADFVTAEDFKEGLQGLPEAKQIEAASKLKTTANSLTLTVIENLRNLKEKQKATKRSWLPSFLLPDYSKDIANLQATLLALNTQVDGTLVRCEHEARQTFFKQANVAVFAYAQGFPQEVLDQLISQDDLTEELLKMKQHFGAETDSWRKDWHLSPSQKKQLREASIAALKKQFPEAIVNSVMVPGAPVTTAGLFNYRKDVCENLYRQELKQNMTAVARVLESDAACLSEDPLAAKEIVDFANNLSDTFDIPSAQKKFSALMMDYLNTQFDADAVHFALAKLTDDDKEQLFTQFDKTYFLMQLYTPCLEATT